MYSEQTYWNELFTISGLMCIFSPLSRLYGVFPEGRLEEYIDSRSMNDYEVRDISLSEAVARKVAKIHNLAVPIAKGEPWLKKIYYK